MDSYSVHAIGANEPPTLMEIANFPHWENVYSNILAFLLDTKKVQASGDSSSARSWRPIAVVAQAVGR